MKVELLEQLARNQLRELEMQQDRLFKTWAPFIKGINEHIKKTQNRELTIHEARTIAQCCQNATISAVMQSKQAKRRRILEATTEDNIDFLGVQLPIIASLIPSLILNEIMIMQAMDRRTAAVFYLDVLYGTDKGAISSGTNMLDARTGHDRTLAGRRYTMAAVREETVTGAAGATGAVSYSLRFAPGVDINTVIVRNSAGDALNTCSAGVLTTLGSAVQGGCSGTVTAAGVLTITPDAGEAFDSDGVTVDYSYQYDLPVDAYNNPSGVPEIDIDVSQDTLEAIDFPVRTKYSIGAAMDLLKAHGMDLESELVKFLGSEVRWTIDHYGIDLVDQASTDGATIEGATVDPATAITTWDGTPSAGEPWIWKKEEFTKYIEEGNNNIITATLRGAATFILAGMNVAKVIRQHSQFKEVSGLNKMTVTGPVKIGDLNGRAVIMDPFLRTRKISGTSVSGSNRYILGYKGDNFLMAGAIYAPYIPLYTTPTLVTSDLMAQKGFMSSAGFKIINPGMYCHGQVTNV